MGEQERKRNNEARAKEFYQKVMRQERELRELQKQSAQTEKLSAELQKQETDLDGKSRDLSNRLDATSRTLSTLRSQVMTKKQSIERDQDEMESIRNLSSSSTAKSANGKGASSGPCLRADSPLLMRQIEHDIKRRCGWAPAGDPLYTAYHDEEWGVPLHDDRMIFELLTLEGAQAGLSWGTILRKRQNFRAAFDNFEPHKVAKFDEKKVKRLISDPGIIRNELKIRSAIQNASAFMAVQKEFGSFDAYVWRFVGNEPKVNSWRRLSEIPAATKESEAMSRDLLRRGFRFVGPTICYAHMQATGMVNDHITSCFRYTELGGRLR